MLFSKFNLSKKESIIKILNKKLIIIICLIIISSIYSYYKFNVSFKNEFINHLTIISKQDVSNNSITYLAKASDKYISNKILLKIYLDDKNKEILANKDMLFFNRYGNFKYGDVIYVGKKVDNISVLNNDYEFNYKNYLSSNNIINTVSVNECKYVYSKNDIFRSLAEYKKDLDIAIEKNITNNSNLFKAIIYGDDLNLDDSIKDKFIAIGQSITLSVSGTNIFSIYIIVYYLFKILQKVFKINSSNKIVNIIFNIILIILYFTFYIFSSFKISVLRVVIIYSLVCMYKIFSKRLNRFKKLIYGSIILYILNPYSVTSISFILGVVATIGIYILFNNVNNFLLFKILKISSSLSKSKKNKFKNILVKKKNIKKLTKKLIKELTKELTKEFIKEIIKKIINITSIYISCNLFIFPIQLYYFNYFSLTSIISNLVINSLYFIQVFLGTMYIMFFKIPIISNILALFNNLILTVITFIVEKLNYINISFNFASPNIITIIIYYLVLLIIIYKDKIINFYVYKLLKKEKINSNNNKISIKKEKLNCKIIVNVVLIILLNVITLTYIYTSYFNVFVNHFNVGQGNMSIIKDKDIAIVLDIGSTTTKSTDYILQNYMLKKGIKDIDFVIISHLHDDHVNGLYNLKDKILNKEIVVKNVIYSIPKDFKGFDKFISFLDEVGINKIVVEKGDVVKIKNISIEFLSPDNDITIESNDSINTHSLVSLVSMYNTHHLFLGDSTVETEQFIINNVDDDIKFKLKNLTSYVVGHHGSKTSSSEEFLKYTKGKYYIISAKKSKFGHPNDEVIDRFKKFSFKYFITENIGNKFINIK